MNFAIKRNAEKELEALRIKFRLSRIKASIPFLALSFGLISVFGFKTEVAIGGSGGYLICAMIFFSLSFGLYRNEYRNKKRFKDFEKTFLKEYSDRMTYSTIIIDNNFLEYESVKKYLKYSWTSFSKYKLYEGNLILLLSNDFNTSIVIKHDEISVNDFSELLNFIVKKIAHSSNKDL